MDYSFSNKIHTDPNLPRSSRTENSTTRPKSDHVFQSQSSNQDNQHNDTNPLEKSQSGFYDLYYPQNITESAALNRKMPPQSDNNLANDLPNQPRNGKPNGEINSFQQSLVFHNIDERRVNDSSARDRGDFAEENIEQSISAIDNQRILSVQSLDASLSFLHNFCKGHSKEEDLVCLTCRRRICNECYFEDHYGHSDSVKHLNVTIRHLRNVIKDCDSYGKLIEGFIQETNAILYQERQHRDYQEEYKQEAQEEVGTWHINNLKSALTESLESENLLKRKALDRIAILERSEINLDFLKSLSDQITPSNVKKYSEEFKTWSLSFNKMKYQECVNGFKSFLLVAKGPKNELLISFSPRAGESRINNRFEELREVNLDLVGYLQPSQDAVMSAMTSLILSFMLFKLINMSYCRVKFEDKPESYNMIVDLIQNCFMHKKLIQVDWVVAGSGEMLYYQDLYKTSGSKSRNIIEIKILDKIMKHYKLDLRHVSTSDSKIDEKLVMQTESLQSFSLNLSRTKLSGKSIQELTKGILTSRSSLESLELDLSYTELTDQGMSEILAVPLERLEHFRLSVGGTSISDLSIQKFANEILSHMILLKHFELHLSDTRVTDESVALVLRILPFIGRLEYIDIDLSYTAVTDLGLAQLIRASLPGVKHLNLTLKGTEVSDRSIQKFASILLPSMRSLEYLGLHLYDTEVTDQSAAEVLAVQIKSLKHLSLNLSRTGVKDKSIHEFGKGMLSSSVSMESLELDLSDTDVTENSVTQMLSVPLELLQLLKLNLSKTKIHEIRVNSKVPFDIKALQHLDLNIADTLIEDQSVDRILSMPVRNLRSFKLDLSETQITDLSIEKFAKERLSFIKELEYFDLDLAGTSVTSKSVSHLFSFPTKALKYFKLTLSDTKVGYIAVLSFTSEMLPHMNILEYLEINFTCTEVTTESITRMLLLPLRTLIHFKLDLSGNTIGDKSLQAFAKGMLPSMKSLKHFELNLSCTSVKDEGVAHILAVPLEKLEVFCLNLWGTKVGDKSILGFAQGMLPSMKALKRFEMDLSGADITDISGAQMFSVPLERLTHFKLDLKFTKVGDTSITNFHQKMLPSLKKLEHFELNLLRTLVTDQSATYLRPLLERNLIVCNIDISRTGASRSYIKAFSVYKNQ